MNLCGLVFTAVTAVISYLMVASSAMVKTGFKNILLRNACQIMKFSSAPPINRFGGTKSTTEPLTSSFSVLGTSELLNNCSINPNADQFLIDCLFSAISRSDIGRFEFLRQVIPEQVLVDSLSTVMSQGDLKGIDFLRNAAPKRVLKRLLFLAINNGDVNQIESLLLMGVDVNCRNMHISLLFGYEPLEYAIVQYEYEIAVFLLKSGARAVSKERFDTLTRSASISQPNPHWDELNRILKDQWNQDRPNKMS